MPPKLPRVSSEALEEGGADLGKPIALDCSACKTGQSMKPTSVPRFNAILRLIGALIVVPSLLGVAFAFLTCFVTSDAANEVMTQAQTAAQTTGAALGAGIGYGISAFIGIGSLLGGLVGWLLLLKRKVFRCARCGFILDRA